MKEGLAVIAKTLMTANEFARTGSETDGFELVRGELHAMPPPRRRHSRVCATIAHLLNSYKKSRGQGEVLGNDAGLITQQDPDTVRGVDAMLYLKNRPPELDAQEDEYCKDPPDLAVEVRSDGQSMNDLLDKANEYLEMGARMAWIVDPSTSQLTVIEPGGEPILLTGEFDGGAVLPGLRFKISEIFE